MSADNWLKRASGLILPQTQRNLACKFRFGVTDGANSCCSEQSYGTCNYCKDGQSPAGWIVTISDAPVVVVGNVTIDINGSHHVWGGGCVWNTNLPYCGSASCTAKVPLQLTLSSDYKVTVKYGEALGWQRGWCGYSYVWEKQFAIEERPVDCLNISNLEMTEVSSAGIGSGAKCKITSHPYAGPAYDECDCHEQVYHYYTPYGLSIPAMTAGPSALEFIIDGQSYTLSRTWQACYDGWAPSCNPGFNPAWEFQGAGDEFPWTSDSCDCSNMQRRKCTGGLNIAVNSYESYYGFWMYYACLDPNNPNSDEVDIYEFVGEDIGLVTLPMSCLGLCNLDVSGTVRHSGSFDCPGSPRWNDVPARLRAVG